MLEFGCNLEFEMLYKQIKNLHSLRNSYFIYSSSSLHYSICMIAFPDVTLIQRMINIFLLKACPTFHRHTLNIYEYLAQYMFKCLQLVLVLEL